MEGIDSTTFDEQKMERRETVKRWWGLKEFRSSLRTSVLRPSVVLFPLKPTNPLPYPLLPKKGLGSLSSLNVSWGLQ